MRIRAFVAALALTLAGGHALAAEPESKPEAKPEAKPATKSEAKPAPELDAEAQAKLEKMVAELNELLASTEPVKCYRQLPEGQITVGLAVEVCSGTTNAKKTVKCFEEAFGHPDNGGLGLTLGQAVKLCKTAQAAARE